jgi:murein DD-endopeptidase MepM/ murein hydrolase activator NlpD
MPFQDTPTRRQLIGSALGAAVTLAAAGHLLTGTDRVAALSAAVNGPAGVADPAVRLGISGKLTFPVDPDLAYGSLVCLNNFGGRSTANGSCSHNGVDIGNDEISGKGRPLLACADGIVAKDEAFSSAGLTRILRDGVGTYYRYHHLDSYESTLSEGDSVTAGQVIGYMGNTGNTSWSHLHFEIWLNSLTPSQATIIDPVPRLPFPLDGVTLRKPTACSR